MSDTITNDSANLDARVSAARAALDTHDELDRVHDIGDSFELGADELPIDAYGWLAWDAEQYKPAYEDWVAAMDRLAAVLGDDFPGRHPCNFRPVCEQILADPATDEATELSS